MKGYSIVFHVVPKLLLATSLFSTLMGSLFGMHTAVHSIAVTAFADSVVVRETFAPIPNLQDFVKTVTNGHAGEVVGIYVPGVLALPVGQQPQGNAGFVTREKEMATQFDLASRYGTVGILAHNDLAGAEFSNIELDQYAIVVYGDGQIEYYLVSRVEKYQALSPTSTYSDFVNLDGSNERLTANLLFKRIYGPGDRLVFQTCIEAQGNPSWGRMFIIAEPATVQVEVQPAEKTNSFLLDFSSLSLIFR
jgi:hypothetical protein